MVLTDKTADQVRREVGMVFQQFNLFPHLNVLRNLTLGPMRVRGLSGSEADTKAMEYLERVRIPEQASKLPGQLSGGQQQRVAIARSLVNDPLLMLADEPTGNLDSKTGIEILDLFDRLNQEGKTIILVTHGDEVAERAQRVIHMKDGVIDREEVKRPPVQIDKSLSRELTR